MPTPNTAIARYFNFVLPMFVILSPRASIHLLKTGGSRSRPPAAAAGGERWIRTRMQNLPLQKEIRERRALLGKFGMHVKLVRNTCEGVQLGGNLGVAEYLQQT